LLVIDASDGIGVLKGFGEQGVRNVADRNRPERLQIMLTGEELRALDDWRFARRMPSRASAIRELLRRGLAVEGVMFQTEGRASATFGVVTDEPEAQAGGGAV
jgi:metal-responsive CopG/Arc/MetJ family transcriptional regulator